MADRVLPGNDPRPLLLCSVASRSVSWPRLATTSSASRNRCSVSWPLLALLRLPLLRLPRLLLNRQRRSLSCRKRSRRRTSEFGCLFVVLAWHLRCCGSSLACRFCFCSRLPLVTHPLTGTWCAGNCARLCSRSRSRPTCRLRLSMRSVPRPPLCVPCLLSFRPLQRALHCLPQAESALNTASV